MKKIFIIFAATLLMVSLVGCGNDEEKSEDKDTSQENIAEELTLSEALSGERSIWFESREIAKDSEIDTVYVFENNKVTEYVVEHHLEYSDLDGLTDDEIIDLASYINENENTSYPNPNPQPVDYKLTIKTDDTGNTTEEEDIVFDGVSSFAISIDGLTGIYDVYDTSYSGYFFNEDSFFVTNTTGKDITFEFDSPGTKGIEVD